MYHVYMCACVRVCHWVASCLRVRVWVCVYVPSLLIEVNCDSMFGLVRDGRGTDRERQGQTGRETERN